MKIILDGNKLMEVDSAHEYLKEKLELPDYYGGNLDALYDCLTEISEDSQLILKLSDEAADSICLKRIFRVMKDAEEENSFLSILVEQV